MPLDVVKNGNDLGASGNPEERSKEAVFRETTSWTAWTPEMTTAWTGATTSFTVFVTTSLTAFTPDTTIEVNRQYSDIREGRGTECRSKAKRSS